VKAVEKIKNQSHANQDDEEGQRRHFSPLSRKKSFKFLIHLGLTQLKNWTVRIGNELRELLEK
jgi:hypothetical protein